MDSLTFGLCKAKEFSEKATEHVEGRVNEARTKAGQHTLKQLKQALEGSVSKVHEKPDVDVIIIEANFQDGLDVDVFNFSLSGLKCRVRMDVRGSAAQILTMGAADAAKGAAKKVSALTGGWGDSLAQGLGQFRDDQHATAAGGEDTKSVEFDVNLDLGVRKAGEEVSTAVTIVGDALDQVDKVIPVKTAVKYVEKAIGDKVQEIIRNWAKEQVKNRIGVDIDSVNQKVDTAKAMLNQGLEKGKEKLGIQ